MNPPSKPSRQGYPPLPHQFIGRQKNQSPKQNHPVRDIRHYATNSLAVKRINPPSKPSRQGYPPLPRQFIGRQKNQSPKQTIPSGISATTPPIHWQSKESIPQANHPVRNVRHYPANSLAGKRINPPSKPSRQGCPPLIRQFIGGKPHRSEVTPK